MTHSLHHLQTCGHNMRAISCKQLGVSGGSSSHYKLGAPYDGQVSGQLREPNNHILGPHSRTPSGGEADDGASCGRKRPPQQAGPRTRLQAQHVRDPWHAVTDHRLRDNLRTDTPHETW
jgi:hypothetical protein